MAESLAFIAAPGTIVGRCPSLRILINPELLAQIFQHLEPHTQTSLEEEVNEENKVRRSTLASAARSCRVLSPHALALLWRRIDNVHRLLSFFRGFGRSPHFCNLFMLQEDITDDDWERFQQYAARVKELHHEKWREIHPITWTFISRRCGASALLPNLERLYVLPVDPASFSTLPLVAPALHSLTLSFDESRRGEADATATYVFLREVARTAPDLKNLVFRFAYQYMDSPDFLQCISDFNKLELLDTHNAVLDTDVLNSLGRCPGLQTLIASIDLGDRDLEEEAGESDEDSVLESGSFQHLTHLSLSGCASDLCAFVLDTCPPALKVLKLEISKELPVSALSTYLANFLEIFGDQGELRELTLRYPHDMNAHVSLMEIVRPALDIETLETVSFDFNELPALTDEDIIEMVDSWPNLRVLHIPTHTIYRSYLPARPTISTLIDIARRCPKLRELTLPEISLKTLPASYADMPFVNHPLLKLRVNFTEDRNTSFRLAVLLDRLFPFVELRDCYIYRSFSLSGEPEVQEDRSKQAQVYLKRMQEGRKSSVRLKLLPFPPVSNARATVVTW